MRASRTIYFHYEGMSNEIATVSRADNVLRGGRPENKSCGEEQWRSIDLGKSRQMTSQGSSRPS
jgi:hypothetical protein